MQPHVFEQTLLAFWDEACAQRSRRQLQVAFTVQSSYELVKMTARCITWKRRGQARSVLNYAAERANTLNARNINYHVQMFLAFCCSLRGSLLSAWYSLWATISYCRHTEQEVPRTTLPPLDVLCLAWTFLSMGSLVLGSSMIMHVCNR